jgi:hypothetical protein
MHQMFISTIYDFQLMLMLKVLKFELKWKTCKTVPRNRTNLKDTAMSEEGNPSFCDEFLNVTTTV